MLQQLEHELDKMATAGQNDTQSSPHSMLRTIYRMFRGDEYDADSEVAYAICGGQPLDPDFIYTRPAAYSHDSGVTLRGLELTNFRCFKSLRLEFGDVDEPVYYLTGRMGVGKTTVINAIKTALIGGAVTKHKTHGTKVKPEVVLRTADGGFYTADRPFGNGILRSAFLQPSTSRLKKPPAEIAASIMQSARCDELSKFLAFVKNLKTKMPRSKEVDTSMADALVDNIAQLLTKADAEREESLVAFGVQFDEVEAIRSDMDAYDSLRDLLVQIYDAYVNMWHTDGSDNATSPPVSGVIMPPDHTESENSLIAALVSQASAPPNLDEEELKVRGLLSEAVLHLIKTLRENVAAYATYVSPDSVKGMYAICDSVLEYNAAHNSCAVCDTVFQDEGSRDAASKKFTDRLDACVYSDATSVVRIRMHIDDKHDSVMDLLFSIIQSAIRRYEESANTLANASRTVEHLQGKVAALHDAHKSSLVIRNASDVDATKVSVSLMLDTLISTLIPSVMESLVFKDLEAVCQVVNTFYNGTVRSGMTLALYPTITGTNKIDIKVKANGTPMAFEELSHGQQNVLCTLFDAAYLAVVDGDTRIIALDDTLTAVDMATAAKVIKYIQQTLKFKLVLVPTQLTDMFLFNYGYVGAAGTNNVVHIKKETTQ